MEEIKIPCSWHVKDDKIRGRRDEIRVDNLFDALTEEKLFEALSDQGYKLELNVERKPDELKEVYTLQITKGEGFDEQYYSLQINATFKAIIQVLNYELEQLSGDEHFGYWNKVAHPRYLLYKGFYFSVDKTDIICTNSAGKERYRKDVEGRLIRDFHLDPLDRGFLLVFDIPESYRKKKMSEWIGLKSLELVDSEGRNIWWAESIPQCPMCMYWSIEKIKNNVIYVSADSHDCEIDLKTGKLLKARFTKV